MGLIGLLAAGLGSPVVVFLGLRSTAGAGVMPASDPPSPPTAEPARAPDAPQPGPPLATPPPATTQRAATSAAGLQGEMELCLRLIKAGNYADARERLEAILAQHPRWPRANLLLALTYHKEQRYELAKPLFARVLELDPTEHAARPFYGWCLYYLGEAQGCQTMFESYLAVAPDYADAHYALGLLALHRDEIDAARGRFETTARLAAASAEPRIEGKARARLGEIYTRTGELEKAREELEQAVRLRPDAYAAYFKLSRVLQRLGDAEGAARARAMHDKVREQVHPTQPEDD